MWQLDVGGKAVRLVSDYLRNVPRSNASGCIVTAALPERIRAEADTATRPGQCEALRRIADEVERMERQAAVDQRLRQVAEEEHDQIRSRLLHHADSGGCEPCRSYLNTHPALAQRETP